MDRLYIKEFGPLKEIDIELNRINLFIGANGSGKSVLAKLVTIMMNDTILLNEEAIIKKIKEFNIDFITNETIIRLYGEGKENDLYIELKNNEIKLSPMMTSLQNNYKNKSNEVENFERITSQYIPAERNLISLFNKSLSTFVIAEIPLPKFLLHFSSQYEKARNEIKELEFLNVKYLNNGRDLIYYNGDEYLDLEHSSSGIQSSLPLYLTTKYFAQKNHRAIIIEEPELNLFPKAQNETIRYIIEQISDKNQLFMMTHSPYVLSTLNILLYAHKVGHLNSVAKEKISQLIPQTQWINPDKFSAYYLEDGKVRNIKGATGLISDNEIDDISDDIASQFDELLEIYREYKNDK